MVMFGDLLHDGSSSYDDGLLGGNHSSDMPTIRPYDVIGVVHTWVIIVVTVLVVCVFMAVYAQLTAVLCYGYKLISYQTIFLYNILLWASFRITLNSFFLYDCCELISKISRALKWFLVSFPEILLFISLSLLVRFFMENLFKVFRRMQDSDFNYSYRKIKFYHRLSSVIWYIFLFVYIGANFSFLGVLYHSHDVGKSWKIVLMVVLETLVFLMGTMLGVSMLVIYVTRAGKDMMDAKRVSKCEAITISVLLLMLFCTRAIYNIVALTIGSNVKKVASFFKYATDSADFNMNQESDIDFFCVLLIWEIFPICLIVLFFRVKGRSKLLGSYSVLRPRNAISRHFFHGPSHKPLSQTDSNINTVLQKSSQVSIPSLPNQSSLPFSTAGYGSTSRTHFSIPNNNKYIPPSFMPGTTPPRLFTGSPSVFSDSRTNHSGVSDNYG